MKGVTSNDGIEVLGSRCSNKWRVDIDKVKSPHPSDEEQEDFCCVGYFRAFLWTIIGTELACYGHKLGPKKRNPVTLMNCKGDVAWLVERLRQGIYVCQLPFNGRAGSL